MALALGNHNFCRNPGGVEVKINIFKEIYNGLLLLYRYMIVSHVVTCFTCGTCLLCETLVICTTCSRLSYRKLTVKKKKQSQPVPFCLGNNGGSDVGSVRYCFGHAGCDTCAGATDNYGAGYCGNPGYIV